MPGPAYKGLKKNKPNPLQKYPSDGLARGGVINEGLRQIVSGENWFRKIFCSLLITRCILIKESHELIDSKNVKNKNKNNLFS